MMESLRQIRLELGKENTLFVHTTLVPYLFGSNELKTKPTQNSIIDLRRLGIQPDIIVTRAPIDLTEDVKNKIALFGSIPRENIIEAKDVNNVYQIPLNFHNQNIEEVILKQFGLKITKSDLSNWEVLLKKSESLKDEVEIALVGKYVSLEDAYLSVKEALKAAGYDYLYKVKINWVDSELLEKEDVNLDEVFKNRRGILVPGGFGIRGIEGKIKACSYARVNKIPYLGICLGMQIATIEFARNVCNLEDANSTEFNKDCLNPIIDLMEEQKSIINMGGTLRLGNYLCKLEKGTLAYDDYNQKEIYERHRHRYEFNNKYKDLLREKGLIFSGINPDADLVEIIELPKDIHPHFIASQFHPEFKSRPTKSHPLFKSFVGASIEYKNKK